MCLCVLGNEKTIIFQYQLAFHMSEKVFFFPFNFKMKKPFKTSNKVLGKLGIQHSKSQVLEKSKKS